MGFRLLFVIVCLFEISFGLKSWELPEGNLFDYINQDLNTEWRLFRKTYNKTYQDNNEEIKRRIHWEDCRKFIQKHNRKYDRAEVSFIVGENEFCDLAEDEFEDIYLKGLILPKVEEYTEGLSEPDLTIPAEIDWRKKGFVSPVKHQGACGSCWAFSAIGALETHYSNKYGKNTDLSEQNLIDCATYKYKNYGCRGGWMINAFQYIISNKGINAERCYPYQGIDGACRFKASCVEANAKAVRSIGRTEHSLAVAVSTVGPASVAIDANHRTFSLYKDGIFYEPKCSRKTINHALVAVGYGTNNNTKYWIVKNSWGTSWGKEGYAFMSRNRNNHCAIASYTSYPIV